MIAPSLAVLLGCGLRRSEVAALTFGHVQQRDGRWWILDLVGSTRASGQRRCRRGSKWRWTHGRPPRVLLPDRCYAGVSIKRTHAYAPFYWEDVEWGALAWRYGYQCTFCPASEAMHGHRKTVARYYTESEVFRVFERNRLLFHLRNLGGIRCLERRLLSLDPQSWADMFHSRGLLDTAWARATAFIAPRKHEVLLNRWKISL